MQIRYPSNIQKMIRKFAVLLWPLLFATFLITSCSSDDMIEEEMEEELNMDEDPGEDLVEETFSCDSLELGLEPIWAWVAVRVNATGGLEPYSYEWLGGDTTNSVDILPEVDYYEVLVTDANGCTETIGAEYEFCNFLSAECGFSGGYLRVTPDNGTPPYSFLWSDGSTDSKIAASWNESATCTITDSNGCQKDWTCSADPEFYCSGVLYEREIIYNLGAGTLSIELNELETCIWSTGEASSTIQVTEPGTYYVDIYHPYLCGAIGQITI